MPPAYLPAEQLLITQPTKQGFSPVPAHQAPPPSNAAEPFLNVIPPRAAPSAIHTQRTELGPFVFASQAPSIAVWPGPLTLNTVSALSRTTRFVVPSPATNRPPVP